MGTSIRIGAAAAAHVWLMRWYETPSTDDAMLLLARELPADLCGARWAASSSHAATSALSFLTFAHPSSKCRESPRLPACARHHCSQADGKYSRRVTQALRWTRGARACMTAIVSTSV